MHAEIGHATARRSGGLGQIGAYVHLVGRLNAPRAGLMTVLGIYVRAKGYDLVPNGALITLGCATGCQGRDQWHATNGTHNRRSHLLDGIVVDSPLVLTLAIRAPGYIGLYKRIIVQASTHPTSSTTACLWLTGPAHPVACDAARHRVVHGVAPGRYCGLFGHGGRLCLNVSSDFIQTVNAILDTGEMSCANGGSQELTTTLGADVDATNHFDVEGQFASVQGETHSPSTWRVLGFINGLGSAAGRLAVTYHPRPSVRCSVSASWLAKLGQTTRTKPPSTATGPATTTKSTTTTPPPPSFAAGRYCGSTSESSAIAQRPLVNLCFTIQKNRIIRMIRIDTVSACDNGSVVVSTDSSSGPSLSVKGTFHVHQSSFNLAGQVAADGTATGTIETSFEPSCDPGPLDWTASTNP
jgi:hypothetical protein